MEVVKTVLTMRERKGNGKRERKAKEQRKVK